MRPIDSTARSVRDLLGGKKYSIDYYQREYRWDAKQVHELIDDLSDMFLEEYEPGLPRAKVAEFRHYFLGSIIISKRETESFIVDGQQRLTSLTLLLILLRSLQRDRGDKVNLDELIFSERYGRKTFNLSVDERASCMEALFEGEPYDPSEQSESVQNLHDRYQDMMSYFPEELREEVLPYFTDWLIDNVHLVEIIAYTDDEAYTIFETMNDRGLSLSPTEMLKGYLLANMEEDHRVRANELWRSRVLELRTGRDDYGSDFFKTWLRSQYAEKIRERRKGASAEDFERIGTEFHRWLRNKREDIGLEQPFDFFRFVQRDFDFYSRQYLRIRKAQASIVGGLEHIYYNAGHGFTLQDLLLLSPLEIEDSEQTIMLKMRIVAQFVDILIAWRIWNFRSIAYSTMQYAMFLVMREIRGAAPEVLANSLHRRLSRETETFRSNGRLSVHQQNRYALHRILARMTDYVEKESGQPSRYSEYVANGRLRYEVEHIWANRPERHEDEFSHQSDFGERRNRIGGLLLLPKSFNASYGDLPYEEKLPHYNSQNLLARSLHPQTYEHNPGFRSFMQKSGLPFRPHEQFKRADLDERSKLYEKIAERMWNPENLLREIEA
ncbi:MAG: DUF262 domain-containing protein [Chloroflexi bacterium]|nr:DUF262 domain-containing protein [Chloroflexota bacterium]